MSKAGFKRMMRARSAPAMRPAPAHREVRPPYEPPSDDQLANFVAVVVNAEAKAIGLFPQLTPALVASALRASPDVKRGWLERHREFCDAAWAAEAGE